MNLVFNVESLIINQEALNSIDENVYLEKISKRLGGLEIETFQNVNFWRIIKFNITGKIVTLKKKKNTKVAPIILHKASFFSWGKFSDTRFTM